MILVTGAGGKTGQAVVRALVERGQAVRAFVRREAQAGPLLDLGAREAAAGDLHDPQALERAARGARAVYHICPNVSPDEATIGRAAIAAARAAGVDHFVFHSVLHPQTEAMPHHWQKLRVEAQLFESGLSFTILQPTAYMQNIAGAWESIAGRGIYPVPYPVETRLSLVDLEDVAAAAAVALTESGHAGATYELVGTGALSQVDVAQALSRALGREVRAEVVPLDEWERQARAAGMEGYALDTLLQMFRYYARSGMWGSPNALGWLLGRPPTPLPDVLDRLAAERRPV